MRSLLGLILFVSFCPANAEFTYVLDCNLEGTLNAFSFKATAKECKPYETLNMSCGDTRTPNQDLSKITIRSPIDSYYSNRGSRNFDRELIKRAIFESVHSGLDPYLILAILMVESPPIDEKADNYLRRYGVPPLDSIAAGSALKCRHTERTSTHIDLISLKNYQSNLAARPPYREDKILRKVKAGEKAGYQPMGPDSPIVQEVASSDSVLIKTTVHSSELTPGPQRLDLYAFDTDAANGQLLALNIDQSMLAANPTYSIESNQNACVSNPSKRITCCANLYVPKDFNKDDARDMDKLKLEVQRIVAKEFISGQFEFAAGLDIVKRTKNDFDRIALIIQSYNGLGKFGSTESVSNDCLSGLDMKTAPIYGTGIADLMINSLMSNSEIRSIVKDAERSYSKKGHSVFCENLKRSQIEVRPKTFSDKQKAILIGRSCPKHSFDFKSGDNLSPQAPASTAQ